MRSGPVRVRRGARTICVLTAMNNKSPLLVCNWCRPRASTNRMAPSMCFDQLATPMPVAVMCCQIVRRTDKLQGTGNPAPAPRHIPRTWQAAARYKASHQTST